MKDIGNTGAEEEPQRRLAAVVWEGDSRDVVKGFPKSIRSKFGADIFNLQRGERPLSFRPMPSLSKGVMELKQRDTAGWYRIVYLSRIDNTLYMLHAFRKHSAKTSKNDLAIVKARLRDVLEAIEQEKKRNG